MADKSISELVAATSIGSTDLFVLEQTGTAKKLTGQILENWLVSYADGHGGIQSLVKTSTTGTDPVIDTYTITYADTTTSTFTVTNGLKGDQGDQTYVWIKYASRYPQSDSDMSGSPDDWIGVYSGTSDTAPTHYTDYTWYQWKGEQGDQGDAATLDSAAISYCQSTSGTEIPSSGWGNTVPSPISGQYLWTRTVLTFNTGSPITFYSVARYGIDGTGSVSSVNNQSPDTNGNVALDASNIPTSDSESVQTKLDASATAAELATFVRPNLLDNWYFIRGVEQSDVASFPINQRGQNSYAGAIYGMDRWVGANSNVLLALNYNKYIVLKSSVAGSQNLLMQYFENKEMFAGKTVTISALINSQLVQSTISVPADSSTWGSTIGSGSDPVNGCAVYLRYLNSKLCFVFYADDTYTANTNILLQAAKIEIGSNQSLAHQDGSSWVLNEIPNYADQLAKCLRFYRRIGGATNNYSLFYGMAFSTSQIRTHVDAPLGMAKVPTIAVSSIENFRLEGNGSAIVPTSIQVNSSVSATQIPVYINAVNLEQYQVYAIVALSSAYIELSADL